MWNFNKYLLTQNIPTVVVLTIETNILEHDDTSSQTHDWLLFSVDEFHYLNAARVGSSKAYNDFDCTFKCLRNPYCRSINLAASKDVNGKLWCELLSSDRYRNSLDYRENETSHHLFLLVVCVLMIRQSYLIKLFPNNIIASTVAKI